MQKNVLNATEAQTLSQDKLASFNTENNISIQAHEINNHDEGDFTWIIFNLSTQSFEIFALCDELFRQIYSPSLGTRKENQLKHHLLHIVLNLMISMQQLIGYSRKKENYVRNRYNRMRISKHYLIPLIDLLEKNKFIINLRGYHDKKNPHLNLTSKMKSTDKFKSLMNQFNANDDYIYQTQDNVEVIRLITTMTKKNKYKKMRDYKDNNKIISSRKLLQRYNELILKTAISHPNPEISCVKRTLHRVFNENFNSGGRYYGGFWINLKKNERQHIIINNNNTIELDYKSLHPAILYNLERIDCGAIDPYNIPELKNISRNDIKKALLIALNAKSLKSAALSLRNEINTPSIFSCYKPKDILTAIINAHYKIEKHFFSGAWKKLQFYDSQLTEKILLHFTSKNIPILPIHDSYICEEQHEKELKEIMEREYKNLFGYQPKITKKKYDAKNDEDFANTKTA